MMEELCLVLRKKRTTRGAIDFDLPEQKVILDEQGDRWRSCRGSAA